jgi:hypothetical protein
MYQYPVPPPARRRPGPAAVVCTLLLLAVGVHLFVRQDNEWERVFVPSAAKLWAGSDFYGQGSVYLYPPFTAWATLPFLGMSHALGRLTFVALNLAGVVFVLRGAWQLAGGGRLDRPAERLAAVVGCLCGVFYLHNCLVHQQTDVFIAALLVGGCLALSGGRPILAATGFGVAAAMKCTPLLWAPYLVWRGRPVRRELPPGLREPAPRGGDVAGRIHEPLPGAPDRPPPRPRDLGQRDRL